MIIKKIDSDDEIIVTYDSSNILASRLNKKTNDLTITFKQGRQYLYENVNPTDYVRFEIADSQGKVFNSHIKQYKNKQIENADNVNDVQKEIDLIKQKELSLAIENKKQQLIHHMETMVLIAKSAKLSIDSLNRLITLANDYKQLIHPVE